MEQWCLPCPHCEELQPLGFKDGIVYEHYVSESGEIVVTKAEHGCAYCGMLGSEKDWKHCEGKWIARKLHTSRRGFHICLTSAAAAASQIQTLMRRPAQSRIHNEKTPSPFRLGVQRKDISFSAICTTTWADLSKCVKGTTLQQLSTGVPSL